MIAVISALRRVSVLVTFGFGAFMFAETNLKQKGLYLLGILAGTLLMTLGSN
jgi:transporter family protein